MFSFKKSNVELKNPFSTHQVESSTKKKHKVNSITATTPVMNIDSPDFEKRMFEASQPASHSLYHLEEFDDRISQSETQLVKDDYTKPLIAANYQSHGKDSFEDVDSRFSCELEICHNQIKGMIGPILGCLDNLYDILEKLSSEIAAKLFSLQQSKSEQYSYIKQEILELDHKNSKIAFYYRSLVSFYRKI